MMQRTRGLSLVEVMVSIFVLFIAVLGLISLFPNMARTSKASANMTKALYVAQARMDRMLSGKVESATETATSPNPLPGLAELDGGVCTTVVSNDPGGDTSLKIVTVTVTWNDNTTILIEGQKSNRSRPRKVQLKTLVHF